MNILATTMMKAINATISKRIRARGTRFLGGCMETTIFPPKVPIFNP